MSRFRLTSGLIRGVQYTPAYPFLVLGAPLVPVIAGPYPGGSLLGSSLVFLSGEEVETRSATYRRTGGVPFSGESGALVIPKRNQCQDRRRTYSSTLAGHRGPPTMKRLRVLTGPFFTPVEIRDSTFLEKETRDSVAVLVPLS